MQVFVHICSNERCGQVINSITPDPPALQACTICKNGRFALIGHYDLHLTFEGSQLNQEQIERIIARRRVPV